MGWSTNEKALEKREKETNKKKQAQVERQQAKQKQKWKDEVTEKKVETAQQRQQRRLKELQRKQQLKRLAEQEEKQLEKEVGKKKNKGEFAEKKLTHAEIEQRKQQAFIEKFEKTLKSEQEQFFQDDNPNKKLMGYEVANTVQGALEILIDEQQRHPERRFKAAFEAYCEKRDLQLKFDYPKFKRSKRLEMMRKEFQKHPDNPYNKKNVVEYNYNPKKKEEQEDAQKPQEG